MKIYCFLFLLLFWAFTGRDSRAEFLDLIPGNIVTEGVNIPKSAILTLPQGKKIELTTVGYGLREKKVVFFNFKVYFAELMVSDPAIFQHSPVKDAALNSIPEMKVALVRLHFLRTVEGKKMKEAFTEGLEINQIDLKSPPVKNFLEAVEKSGSAESGKAMVLAGDFLGGRLFFQNTDGIIREIAGDSKFLKDIFSIWLGVTHDEGLGSLKSALIGE